MKTNKTQNHALRFVLLAVAFVSGCGSSSSGADAGRFVGSWSFDSATINVMCGGMTLMPQDLSGAVLTLDSASGNEVVLNYSEKCMVHFTVSGSAASAKPNQTCQLHTKQAGDQDVALTSWTLTLDSDTAISTQLTGTALLGNCTVSGSGKLSRQDTDGGTG